MRISTRVLVRCAFLTFSVALFLAALWPATAAHAQFDRVTKIARDANGDLLSGEDDAFGFTVASFGSDPSGQLADLAPNADEVHVAAVGAPGVNDNRGAVYGLALDGDTGEVTRIRFLAPSGVLAPISGSAVGDRFGSALTATTNVAAGGAAASTFVGAPFDGPGTVFLYGLRINSSTLAIEAERQQTYDGSGDASGLSLETGDRFGSALERLGDINGDPDTREVAVGARGANGGDGAVYILSVDTTGSAADASQLETDVLATLNDETLGVDAGKGLGSSIAALGDVDGNGRAEVAVGAAEGGVVHLISVASDASASVIGTYDGAGESFGQGAGSYPSVDGDSTVVVGHPDDGPGTFMHLKATGDGYRRIGTVGPGNLPGTTLSPRDEFARSLAGVTQDLDGNGFAEVFAGAPGDDTNGEDAGVAYMLFANQAELPVEFAGAPQPQVDGRGAVVLQWKTLSEQGNAGFHVEHRRAGTEGAWTTANPDALVPSQAEGGTAAATAHTYDYRVAGLAPGRYVFRVTQVDADGARSAGPPSAAVEVGAAAEGVALHAPYPNPLRAGETAELTFDAPGAEETATTAVEAGLYNSLGQQVRALEVAGGRVRVAAQGLASGLYVVRLTVAGRTRTQSLTVVR
jgi:hypothetical protein